MPLTIACQNCRQHYAVEEQYAGQAVDCPACGGPIIIPRSAANTLGPHQAPEPEYTAEPVRSGGVLAALAVIFVLLLFGGSMVGLVLYLANLEPPSQDRLVQADEKQPKQEESAPVIDKKDTEPPPEKKDKERAVVDAKDKEKDKQPPDDRKDKAEKKEKQPPVRQELPPPSPRPWVGHLAPVIAVAVSADGKSVWTAAGGADEGKPLLDSTIRRWDVATGKESDRIVFPDGVACAALAPDAKRAAVAAVGSRDVELWDLAAKKKLHTLAAHDKNVRCLAFSADGRRLVSGGDDNALFVWDVAGGKKLAKLTGHTNSPNVIAVAPDGRAAITGGLDHTARLWDLDRGEQSQKEMEHKDIVWAAAFSADGKLALSGGGGQKLAEGIFNDGARDYEVRCFDAKSAAERRRFAPLGVAVTALAFSPDGRRFLAGGKDGDLRLWQMGTAKEVKRLSGHTARVLGVAFFAGGRRAVSVGEDKSVRVWDLPPDLPDLVRDLGSDTAEVRLAALEGLTRLGADAKPAIVPLFDSLARNDDEWRGRVLALLRSFSPLDKEHVARLTRLLEEKKYTDGRLFALDELAKLGDAAKPAAKALLAALADTKVEVRRGAMAALAPVVAEVGDEAFEPLLEALRDRDDAIRGEAEKAIDKLGTPAAKHLGKLRGLLKDEGVGVRRFAVKSLGEMGEPAAAAVGDLATCAKGDASADVRRQALEALMKLAPEDPRTIGAARKGLDHEDAGVNRAAVKALALARDAEGLVAAMGHADPEVNKAADDGLKRVKLTKKQMPLVIKLLEGKKAAAPARGLEAAEALGDEAAEAVPALADSLRVAEDEEQKKILAALVKMGPAAKKAGPAVARLLESKDRSHKVEVRKALAAIEAEEASKGVAWLVGQLRAADVEDFMDEDAAKYREKARAVLVRVSKHVGKPAVRAVIGAIEGDFSGGSGDAEKYLNAQARFQAVRALGEMGPKAKKADSMAVMTLLANMQKRSVEPVDAIRAEAKKAYLKVQEKE